MTVSAERQLTRLWPKYFEHGFVGCGWLVTIELTETKSFKDGGSVLEQIPTLVGHF